MGWLSDPLFGKKKKLDPYVINSHMKDYDQGVQDMHAMGQSMMGVDSKYNRQMFDFIRSNTMDQASNQNQNMLGFSAASGMNPAQAAMQARANMHTARQQTGQQFQQQFQANQQQGMSLLDAALRGHKDIGERNSNMYMQEINAANQARNNNMNMAMTGLGAIAGGVGGWLGAGGGDGEEGP